MEYVVAKYGRERVAQIITFGKLAAKAATRDVGRVLGLPFATVDRIAKFIPEGVKVGFDECMKPGQELRAAYDDPQAIGRTADGTDITARDLIDMARPLEGLIRQDGIHAAAVVIGDRPLVEYLPLQRKGVDKELVTQYAMGDVERLGPAQDGLPRPAQPRRDRRGGAADRGARRAQRLDMESLPLDDAPTFEMLAARRRHRRVPVRVQRHARGPAPGAADGVRRPHRARGAVPARPDANIPMYARRKNGRGARHLHRPAARADPGVHAGRVHLPGAGDADRQGARRLLARPGRRPAQGHRQEERRADGHAQGRVPRGLRRQRRRAQGRRAPLGTRTSAPPTTPSTRPTPPATR